MTIEQIKAEAKKRFGQDLTDEQAEAILENHSSEELSAQVLEEVTGGATKLKITYVDHSMPDVSKLPRVFLFLNELEEEARKRFGQGFPGELTEAMLKAYDSGELSAQELEDVVGGLHYELKVCPNSKHWGTINVYNTEELSPQELEEVRGGSDYKLRIPLSGDLLSKLEPYAADGQLKEWLAARSSKELSDQELDNVAGGWGPVSPEHTREVCPKCGGKNLKQTREGNFWNNMCEDCGWHEGGVDY